MATRKDPKQRHGCQQSGAGLRHRPVTESKHLDHLFESSFPSFGGAFLRRIWTLLDEAIGMGLPMTMSVSGPVTASGQHYAWLNPLLDTGWFAYLSVTDAICYHDAHRALESVSESDFTEVPIFGDDGQLRDEEIIRITDIGFPEGVLLDTDRYLCRLLRLPEFQRRMTGPEFRNLLGAHFAAAEQACGAQEGLMALCQRKSIPVFVGAPADGSVFLNSTLLWALAQTGGDAYAFELDLHGEVMESCAYHHWGLFESAAQNLGTVILGGGVPKNFSLQPEPALSQIFGFDDIRGYLYDIQITTAPVTDGSLSSCPPAEAVTWGKVDKENYRQTTESFTCDYSIVMPLLTKALLDKRARLQRLQQELGMETLLERHPEAAGYLRPTDGFRLFDQRATLLATLMSKVRDNAARLRADSGLSPA
jgi:deoxyhypusine synthase